MKSLLLLAAVAAAVLAVIGGAVAAVPVGGTISSNQPTATWSGGPFLTSNPTSVCLPADPACDHFALTVATPLPKGDYAVEVAIDGKNAGDDYDLYVYGSDGEEIDSSATSSGDESVNIRNLPPGTYDVVVLAWLVEPGSTYAGQATIAAVAAAPKVRKAKAFEATVVTAEAYSAGAPANSATSFAGPALSVSANYVGRQAAEPTLGVNANGTAFFTASTFDAVGDELARTELMRSRDGGKSWESVQPGLLLDTTTEPPTTLDPYVHVDPVTGRVFTIDLYAGCSYLLFSDDEGQSWTRNPLACGQPVNDHHTIQTGPPVGAPTVGYANALYYCFNRVGDSSCGKSLDGGQTFVPAGTAFLGVDPAAGGVCGGLHGHLATDYAGRVFLPKGHCGFPWVARSEDGATTFTRVKVNGYVRTSGHEVSLAVDRANNVYAVWFDNRDHLPYLAVSTDHGSTWSQPAMVAPPSVHEVNFPTIAAGDAGRIALHFPGTASANRDDKSRPWNSYELVSTNALSLVDGDPATNPVFTFTTANDLADPVHRGDCNGRCGGMFDFLDIQTSPADGSFWAAASDTYYGGKDISPGQGLAVRQTGGALLVPTAGK